MQTLTVHGVRMGYEEAGSGTPVVCLHGFPLNHQMWREQLSGLSSHARIIAPDLRGFGATDVLAGSVTMEQFADDINALLDALQINEPIVLCGLSMGGYIAWSFTRKYRHRLKGLILCDTRAVADTPEGVTNRHRLVKLVLENGPQAIAAAMLPNLFARKTVEQRGEIVEFMRQMMLSNQAEGIAAALLGMAERPDVRSWLPSIDLPSLLVVGSEDKISTAAEMWEIAAAMPQAQLLEVPDAGHMAPLENPEPVNRAIIKFLQRL